MKIVFMGTPEFALPSLKALIDCGYDISAVVTQPDKPRGRGGTFSFSPVKEFALSVGIRVLQYQKIRFEGVCDLKEIAPDLIVTAAYGQILTQEIIDVPRFGILNVHASLLPKYRGAAPIQWAVINGETVTGITIMKTALSLDSGGILLQKSLEIGADETAGELFSRLSVLGAEALIEGIKKIEDGTAVFYPQNEAFATYFKTIKKEDAKISFEKTPSEIVNFVRGMNPSPTAYTLIGGENVKIYRAEAIKTDGINSILNADEATLPRKINGYKAGDIIRADVKNGLIAAAGGGAVRLSELQFPNGKRMKDTDYLRGHKIAVESLS
ncbi:MAG: methionyl-tRNA formyltransferase [Clostridiales bacterium]|jgi:methionyl-tRNA formyltransferase|nr:methionyl-tRNA formyltransferase [Clostridiales bacterium]